MSYKIAIVGQPEITGLFAAVGMDVVNVLHAQETANIILNLKKQKGEDDQPLYAIIYVTENLMGELTAEDYKKVIAGALPAVVPVPTHLKTNFGQTRLQRIVEKAVGANIL
ncbi:MAG TPA: V-type ATP synthase subunit F [Candidatus Gracilibacteria bacterium]|nr:V-type ATP synthase subunit F [Candidatus Gracilibacteria bacterium]